MSWVVTAPLVLARDKTAAVHHVYEGGVIDWLPPEQAAHFLGSGLVERIGDAESERGIVDPEAGDDEKPAMVATKAVLVDWLIGHGEYDRAKLEEQTKAELWELIEATD
jgi:hypothetical protein